MFTRKPVLDKALRRRVAVNAVNGNTLFVGRLAEYDKETFVLEQCETVAPPSGTPTPLPGRHYVDRVHAFLTELQT